MKRKMKTILVITGALLVFMTCIPLSLSGCTKTEIPPLHGTVLPAFWMSVQLPDSSNATGTIKANPGETLILPVKIEPTVKTPFSVRLMQGQDVPEFITIQSSADYVEVLPWETPAINITINIADDAPTGYYQVELASELKEPVEDRPAGRKYLHIYINYIYEKGNY